MAKKQKDYLEEKILDFIGEAGMLKSLPRSGWRVLGIKTGESIADHSFRCAVLGYILSHMEKVPVGRVVLMCLFNDIHESRTTDLHKLAQRYFDTVKADRDSFKEQTEGLPLSLRKDLASIRKDYDSQKKKESIVARDADILECLIQAKEYYEQGFTQAALFMKKAPEFLVTKSARCLWKRAKNKDFSKWWFSISEFKR
jgi:putative hydrolases of HD superfamily